MSRKAKALEAYIRDTRPRFETELEEMVRVPSISMDPAHAADVRRMAVVAADVLKGYGAEADIVETGGYPVVTGGWTTGRHHPTVAIYNHMDVQPAVEPEWRQAPFAFRKEDGVYHGRGATDDKGPALTALLASRYAVDQGIPLNIRFVWELEEEIGSPNFGTALKQRSRLPKPDSVMVSDTVWVSRTKPAIPYGLRGLLAVSMTLRTGRKDAHSGLTGGAARNPLTELVDLASRCVDARTGRVTIPGFYKDVVPPTRAEIRSYVDSGFDVKRFMNAYGFRTLRTMDPAEALRRVWAMPTFEVHGLVGGHVGPGIKTVVPGTGELKVSMRLVPNQRPKKIFTLFKQFVNRLNPDVKVTHHNMLEPFRGERSGPYADAARRAACLGFGREPAFIREGGSIGAAVAMQSAWRVPITFLGLSLPEHGYHAPNEFFDWGQAAGGMRAFVAYFAELSAMDRRGKK